jgi:hypothetical protein
MTVDQLGECEGGIAAPSYVGLAMTVLVMWIRDGS